MGSTVAGIVGWATYQFPRPSPTNKSLTSKAIHAHERCESGPLWADTIESMKSKRVHITLTPRQTVVLDKLCRKLLLDRSEVVRLAVARLAEAEDIKP